MHFPIYIFICLISMLAFNLRRQRRTIGAAHFPLAAASKDTRFYRPRGCTTARDCTTTVLTARGTLLEAAELCSVYID